MAKEETKEVKISGQQAIQLYQIERAKMETVQRKVESIQKIIIEMDAAISTLDSIKNAKQGDLFLVPLGAGVYTEARMENTKQVKASLAGSIMVNQDIEETLKKLGEQKGEALKSRSALQQEGQVIANNLNNLGLILQQMERQPAQNR